MHLVCTAFVASATVVSLYHVILAAIALVCRQTEGKITHGASHSFAIVIPAHNEEGTIATALRSCSALDYPKHRYTVYVVADNCDDRTTVVAAAYGARCLTRRDEQRRGKGPALEYAFQRILPDGHDAVLVLDADCALDANALGVFARHLESGARVLQASYVVANPDENAVTYLLALANVLENDLFYAPKSLLGLAVFLRGTGMAFHREVLESHPWQARALVEDTEYSCQLLKKGVPIRFVPNVRVASDFPIRNDQLAVQRARWIHGGFRHGRTQMLGLLWTGLAKGKLRSLDAGLTALMVSRPLIVAQLLLTALISFLLYWIAPGPWSTALLYCTLAIVASYLLYVGVGVALLGVTTRRLRLLLATPVIVVQYLLLALKAIAIIRPSDWARTPRLQNASSKR